MDFNQEPKLTVSELLDSIPNLTDRVLQQEYLNRVEYIDLIMSAIALIEDETQAIRIVELTWEVNKKFAARLAGIAHPQVQQQTVGRLKELIKESVVGLHLQIKLLSETSSQWVVADLINLWKFSYSPYLNIGLDVYYAIKSIYAHQNPTINTPIINFLSERLQASRFNTTDTLAIKLLGEIGDTRTLPILLSHLQNSSLWIQNPVVIALGQIGSLQAFDSLLIALQDSYGDSGYSSRCAAKSLGLLGDERAVKPLIQAIGDFSPIARWGAVEALAIIGTEEAIDAVIKLLEDEIRWINRTSPCTDEDEIRWTSRISPKTGKWIRLNASKFDVKRSNLIIYID
jgi:HEAT repeats